MRLGIVARMFAGGIGDSRRAELLSVQDWAGIGGSYRVEGVVPVTMIAERVGRARGMTVVLSALYGRLLTCPPIGTRT